MLDLHSFKLLRQLKCIKMSERVTGPHTFVEAMTQRLLCVGISHWQCIHGADTCGEHPTDPGWRIIPVSGSEKVSVAVSMFLSPQLIWLEKIHLMPSCLLLKFANKQSHQPSVWTVKMKKKLVISSSKDVVSKSPTLCHAHYIRLVFNGKTHVNVYTPCW